MDDLLVEDSINQATHFLTQNNLSIHLFAILHFLMMQYVNSYLEKKWVGYKCFYFSLKSEQFRELVIISLTDFKNDETNTKIEINNIMSLIFEDSLWKFLYDWVTKRHGNFVTNL